MVEPAARDQSPTRLEPEPRKRSPAKRFFLFSAGGTAEVLDECPHSEERLIAGLGSLVLVTTSLALLSMFVMGMVGLRLPWYEAAPASVVWAAVIYVIDRFLVSVPLNPHRFTPQTVTDNAVYIDPPFLTRLSTFIKTVLGVVPRLFLALTAGILIAEPLLLVAFHPEVRSRVEEIQGTLTQRKIVEATNNYKTAIKDEAQPQTPEAQALHKDEELLKGDLPSDLPSQIQTWQTNVNTLKQALEYEVEGGGLRVPYTDPIDGQNRITTGNAGTNGTEAATLALHLSMAQRRLDALDAQQATLQRRVDDLSHGKAAQEEASRQNALSKLITEQKTAIQNAKSQAKNAGGLLMQVQALEQLARESDPFAEAPSSVGTEPHAVSRGAAPVTSHAKAGIFGLTTLGLVVWLTRIFIILIDTMAIFGKLFLSLRRRRPYDAVTAEHEERAVIYSTERHLDNLNDLSRKRMEIAVQGFVRRKRVRGDKAADSVDFTTLRPYLRVVSPNGTRTYAPTDGESINVPGKPDSL